MQGPDTEPGAASVPAAAQPATSGGQLERSGVPTARDRQVPRNNLIDRLMSSQEPVISVVAPPGYGKTTLLAQWAERLGPRVAWVSCERADNDPVVLWTGILSALNRIEPVGADALPLLARATARRREIAVRP